MSKCALLVGVERYRDPRIAPLQFAAADAIALAERLRDRCAFDRTVVLTDHGGDAEPDLVNITNALSDLAGELREEDLFLFFFSGHGIEVDGHGYLLTRDSPLAFPEHCSLSLQLLRKTLERLAAGKRVLLMDACRNSPEAGKGDADNAMTDAVSKDIVAAARSSLSAGVTTALLSACRPGQRAYEWPSKRHGAFTHFLLEGLDGPAWSGSELEFKRLAGYAFDRVRGWAQNTPGLSGSQEPWYEEFGDPEPILLAGASAIPPPITSVEAPSQHVRSEARRSDWDTVLIASPGDCTITGTFEEWAKREYPFLVSTDLVAVYVGIISVCALFGPMAGIGTALRYGGTLGVFTGVLLGIGPILCMCAYHRQLSRRAREDWKLYRIEQLTDAGEFEQAARAFVELKCLQKTKDRVRLLGRAILQGLANVALREEFQAYYDRRFGATGLHSSE